MFIARSIRLIPLKTWQARGAENQQTVETTEKEIREEFKRELGSID